MARARVARLRRAFLLCFGRDPDADEEKMVAGFLARAEKFAGEDEKLRGQALALHAGAEHTRALSLLRARYPQYSSMGLDTRPIIAVRIERVVEWRYS